MLRSKIKILVITFYQITSIHTATGDHENLSVSENANIKILIFFCRCTQKLYLFIHTVATDKRHVAVAPSLQFLVIPKPQLNNNSILRATHGTGQQIFILPISFNKMFFCVLYNSHIGFQRPYYFPWHTAKSRTTYLNAGTYHTSFYKASIKYNIDIQTR